MNSIHHVHLPLNECVYCLYVVEIHVKYHVLPLYDCIINYYYMLGSCRGAIRLYTAMISRVSCLSIISIVRIVLMNECCRQTPDRSS